MSIPGRSAAWITPTDNYLEVEKNIVIHYALKIPNFIFFTTDFIYFLTFNGNCFLFSPLPSGSHNPKKTVVFPASLRIWWIRHPRCLPCWLQVHPNQAAPADEHTGQAHRVKTVLTNVWKKHGGRSTHIHAATLPTFVRRDRFQLFNIPDKLR